MKKFLFVLALLASQLSSGQNIFPNTGNVGIGTNNPFTKLSVIGAITLGSGLTNMSARPLISSNTLPNGEIRAFRDENYLYDDGFLRISAGGGTNGLVKSYIDLSGYSNLPDMDRNIVIGTSGIERMRIITNGNIGIGTAIPLAKLHVNNGDDSYGTILANASENNFSLYAKTLKTAPINTESFRLGLKYATNENNGFISFYRGANSGGGFLGLSTNGIERLLIAGNGNVGIGTAAPDEKLTVKGKIHTQEVRVDMDGPLVPDYVFNNDYQLNSLAEVESYIRKNKHLPEIPSATAFEKNGVMLAQMNMLLLKKIEELTLYAIEQEKKTEKLMIYLKEQNRRIQSLEYSIENKNEK